MHPSWQRDILKNLKQTFPNIQFVITTHSPIVLNEIDDSYKTYFLKENGTGNEIIEYERLDGFDANYILEEFMGTKSMNENTEMLINSIYKCIDEKLYDEADKKVIQLEKLTDKTNKHVITAKMMIQRGRFQ